MYDLLTASEIRKRFRTTTSRDFSLKAIHDVAQKIGYKQKHIGSKVGYHKSVYTALTRHFWELVEYNEQLLSKTQQKPKKQVNTDNYYTYNGERDNVDYDWERSDESISNSMIKSAINEAIDELELYHGSQASFDEFDLAYLSSGWGQQAYGYGVYLISTREGARDYARGGYIYMAKVPNKPYLSYSRISRQSAYRIAKALYEYYLKYDEYGKEAYKGHEDEFWEYECGVICDCQNGGDVYGTIASILGSDKKTSEFLYGLGYKGIKWVDKHSKNTNYVIFNPKDIQILERKGVNENVSNENVNSVLKSSNPNYVDLKTAVRNFNKWFKGSKVVETNGDPLLCYHGTPKGGFYVFNTIEGVDKKTKWQLLFGSHFTNDKEQGEYYMGNNKRNKNKMLYTVFLSIKNPLDVTKNGEHSILIRYTDGTSGYDRHPEMIDKIDSILSPRMVKKYKLRDSHSEGYVLWNLLNDMTPYNARKLVEALGFDGIKYDARYQMGTQNERTDVSWIALYPNQIKSASENSGMFSSKSNDIREGRDI